ncbi:MAG: hypothetical protein ACREDD_12940 [Methylocella sp.]
MERRLVRREGVFLHSIGYWSVSNRKIFNMDAIVTVVFACPATPSQSATSSETVRRKTHQEERERLANEKCRLRGKFDGQLGQPQRGIDRLWADYEAERISMIIAGPKLKVLHAQKPSLEEQLIATAPEEKKIVAFTQLRCWSTKRQRSHTRQRGRIHQDQGLDRATLRS